MDNTIYIAMQAANLLFKKQEITNNNLANSSTIGFKKKYLLHINNDYVDMNGFNLNNNHYIEFYDSSSGSFMYTQNPLDIAIQNNGWIAVKDPQNNKILYTRNGHFNVNEKGILNINGKYVLGIKGIIYIPTNVTIQITENGNILAIKKNNKKNQKLKIDQLQIDQINLANMKQSKNGMFYVNKKLYKKKINSYKKNIPKIQPKTLEKSNVNPITSIIDMISDARLFEMNMKMITHIEEMTQMSNHILNINT